MQVEQQEAPVEAHQQPHKNGLRATLALAYLSVGVIYGGASMFS